MTFRQFADNNGPMQATAHRIQNGRNGAVALAARAAILLLLVAAFFSQAGAQGGDANKLTWDYAVAPSVGVICEPATVKYPDCVQSFVIAYQAGKNKFKPAATLKASEICVRRKEKGGGWTCSAAIPVVPGKKGKAMTWAVSAVTASGLKSAYSNPVTK